jgi:hypothetical protein
MRDARTSILAVITILLAAALAGAQPAEEPTRPGYGWGAGRGFDPATLETVEGEILEVTSAPSPGWRRARGVHMSVETEGGPVAVQLGPQWYLQGKGVALAAGQRVTVTGSRVSQRDGQGLVATEVRRGESVLRLRASDGTPAWGGWSRGGGWEARGGGWGRGRAGRSRLPKRGWASPGAVRARAVPLSLAVVLLGSAQLAAPAPPAAPVEAPLDLDGCIAEALESNPRVLQWRSEHRAALARVNAPRAFPQPTVAYDSDLQPNLFHFGQSGESYLGLVQAIEFPGERGLRGRGRT